MVNKYDYIQCFLEIPRSQVHPEVEPDFQSSRGKHRQMNIQILGRQLPNEIRI